MSQALLLVDLQYDFFPGGALGVARANEVISYVNTVLRECPDLPVYLTRDWHPAESRHFNTGGGVWPVHCVQNTDGARLHEKLNIDSSNDRFRLYTKGTDPNNDGGYSAFEGTSEQGEGLESHLRAKQITTLVVMGLATDYCVKQTVLNALDLGFKVKLLLGGIRAVNINPDDGLEAIEEMEQAGAELIQPGWLP